MSRFSTRRGVSYGSFSLYGSRGRQSRNRNILGFLFFIVVCALPVMLHSRSDDPAASQGTPVATDRGHASGGSSVDMKSTPVAARPAPADERVANVVPEASVETTYVARSLPLAQAPRVTRAAKATSTVAKQSTVLARAGEVPKPNAAFAKAGASSSGTLARVAGRKKSRTGHATPRASHSNAPQFARHATLELKPAFAYNSGSSQSYRSRGLVAAPK